MKTGATSTCRPAGCGCTPPPSTNAPSCSRPRTGTGPTSPTPSPVGSAITLPGWAEITDVATVTEPEHLAALDSKSVWTDDYAQSRLKWKRRDPLWVLVLRVHRLT